MAERHLERRTFRDTNFSEKQQLSIAQEFVTLGFQLMMQKAAVSSLSLHKHCRAELVCALSASVGHFLH